VNGNTVNNVKRAWILLCLSILLGGCAGAIVEFDSSAFPTPLVEVTNINVGLVLDEELTSYVHVEEIDMYGGWEVPLGLVQPLLFKNVLGAMFLSVTEVESATEVHPELDAVLVPAILGFQMSIPSQTSSNLYEVWIKYRLLLYDNKGELIVEWEFPAYGRSNKEDYGMLTDKDEPALEDATMTALRDAAAEISLKLRSQPEMRAWLAARAAQAPVVSTDPDVDEEEAESW
jgi:hypothetical protein